MKQKVLEKLKTKKIIIFGTGNCAYEFLEKYSTKLNVDYCISNNIKEKYFGGLQVACPQKKTNEDSYIIICSMYKVEIYEQLEQLGYKINEDFIHWTTAKTLLENKKICLVLGVCHTLHILEALKTVDEFKRVYDSYFYELRIQLNKWEYNELISLCKLTDLCIYGAVKTKEEKLKLESILNSLDSKTIKVSTPLVVWQGLWPQVEKIKNSLNIDFGITFPFTFGDININKMICENRSFDEIYSVISKEDFYTKEQVLKNLEKSFRVCELTEKYSDIKILDYIKDSYRKKWLYKDYKHINSDLIWEYARRILKFIGYGEIDVSPYEKTTSIKFNITDMPIYPSVIKYLELEFVDSNTKYSFEGLISSEKYTFKEYVEKYVKYGYLVKHFIEIGEQERILTYQKIILGIDE